jgi:hypothetical protein
MSAIATLLSAVASLAAVLVAVTALNSNRAQTRLDAQAWIGPKLGPILTVTDADNGQIVQTFTNTGHTPAENARVSNYTVVLPTGITRDQLATTIEDNDDKTGFSDIGTVPAGESLQVEADPPLSLVHFGESILYFRVRIEYEDIFGNRHKTYDCSQVTSVVGGSVAYGVCPIGKRMD